MTISVPSEFAFQSSNVTDITRTIRDLTINCQAQVITKGLEVVNGEWVYEYNGLTNFTPPEYDSTDADNGVYNLDDIVFRNCKLYKVTGKSGSDIVEHRRPLEPEEYSSFDTEMDYTAWTHRWVRVKSNIDRGYLERLWTVGTRQYTIVWSAKYNKNMWQMRDMTASAQCGATNQYVIKTTSKYDAAYDRKAYIIDWSASGCNTQKTIKIASMIERNGFFYLRTNVNAKIEYEEWETGGYDYTFMEVTSPADIDGFIQKRRHNAHCPFDGKNYTHTVFSTSSTKGYAEWSMVTTQDMDSIAFGRVMADEIDVLITDQDGVKLFEITNYEVDNTLDDDSTMEYPSTVIIYADSLIPLGSVVTVKIYRAIVEIGEMIPGAKLDAGFTNLAFKNKFKDFSPKEQDQWGNFYYIDGVRVQVHSGTVDLPVLRYDQLNRLMLMIGGQKIFINSSDSTDNHLPDGLRIFEATMMIARFTSFELSTQIKDKRIGDTAKYSFALEEIV